MGCLHDMVVEELQELRHFVTEALGVIVTERGDDGVLDLRKKGHPALVFREYDQESETIAQVTLDAILTDNPYNEDGKPSRYPFDDVDFDTLASLLEHMENRYAPPGIGTGAVWCIRRLGQ